MHTALDTVERWCLGQNLRVNPTETELVLFTRRRNLTLRPPTLYGVELKLSREVRYLGVNLDSRLTWKSHITKQAQKAMATSWACRRNDVWTNLGTETRNGSFRTTPTVAMCALLNLLPPHVTAMAEARNTACRLYVSGRWIRARQGHVSILQQTEDHHEVLSLGGDRCPTGSPTYSTTILQSTTPANVVSQGGLVWFTDAAKSGTGAGAGVWCGGPRMEKCLRSGPAPERSWTRDTDASTFLYAATIRSCVDLLSQLARDNRVNLIWVPGHAGIRGNEEAHDLARQGTRGTESTIVCSVGVPAGHVRTLNRQWAEVRLLDLWRHRSTMRHTRVMLEHPSSGLGSTLVRLDRDRLRLVVGLVTRHWHTGRHLARLGLRDNPTCPRCGEADETPLHVIAGRRALEDSRERILGDRHLVRAR
ncbi:uncharacterized protein LOC128878494 [Hylaeus volcanicus]|uniref:uncharacterized protein LOC128878494 n=1 Tax=Hylaeus volcanicus TaxID=313075 RepID=UPI0023B79721|nr:uncharacterized protein LOC128878494 [Hylaeus volcanicus]